jgi:hypothetical protein
MAAVQFEFPLQTGALNFYSIRPNRVVMPIDSLKFTEDLCTAYAWLWHNGYKLDTVDLYLSMLRYRQPWGNHRRYPPPLEALHIPDDALQNPQVDELSLRFRNSAYWFILAHELGHICHRHNGYQRITRQQARNNEEQADRFALRMLQRTKTIPMGAQLFFQASTYYFDETDSTHPLTSRRLRILAQSIYADANGFVNDPKDRATVIFIARKIMDIADDMEDPKMQRAVRHMAEQMDPVAGLKPSSRAHGYELVK